MCYNIYRLRIRLSLYSFRRYGDGTNIYRLSNSLSFRLKMCANIYTRSNSSLPATLIFPKEREKNYNESRGKRKSFRRARWHVFHRVDQDPVSRQLS
ncbi:hypothetical protein [Frog virus 3]